MTKVGVLSTAFSLESPEAQNLMKDGANLRVVDRKLERSQLIAELSDCEAVIAGTEGYPSDLLENLPNLRLIARTGVGTEGIDSAAAHRLGIEIFTTPGVNADAVAEHALTLLLAVLHKVVILDLRVRAGDWRDKSLYSQLSGLRVGVIGYGQIGRRFAKLASCLGAEVQAYDPGVVDEGLEIKLEKLLEWSQAISLHLPLNESTRGLIGKRELDKLPTGAVLINTSRGGVLDESALCESLGNGRLGGAGLDVFDNEPLTTDSRICSFSNVVLSPHISSFSTSAVEAMSNVISIRIREKLLKG